MSERRRRTRGGAPLLVAARLLLLGLAACGDGEPDRAPPGWDGVGLLVLEGATVYPSPRAPPLEDGVVVILDGVIEAVGERGRVQVPPGAPRWNARGLSVLAGFWNAHVRLDPELLSLAEGGSAGELERALAERFLRFGFTTVVETSRPRGGASEPTEALLERIGSGEVAGPGIWILDEPGLVGIHLPGAGTLPWDEKVLSEILATDGALVPALSLFGARQAEASEAAPGRVPEGVGEAMASLGAYARAGGRLVFGTGAGYVPQYDPLAEVYLLEEAGVPFETLLGALTTEPALRLGVAYRGEVEPGMVADLVIVEGDPEVDAGALGRVRRVLLQGRLVFDAGAPGRP